MDKWVDYFPILMEKEENKYAVILMEMDLQLKKGNTIGMNVKW